MATSMGCSTSKSRVNWPNADKDPPKDKLVSNTAHGAKMGLPERNRPDGWATFGGGNGPHEHMRLDNYGKSGRQQTRPSISFNTDMQKPKAL